MAKKRLTPRQQEWETEYKKLQRRVRDWKRKFHAIPDLPQKPERITKKDIERLKQFKWRNISEVEKKQWRKEYEYRYENKMPEVYQPKPPYTPPSEQDYFNNPDYGDDYDREWEEQHPDWEEPDVDGWTDTIDSRAEIEAWIERTIDSIEIEETHRQGEVPGVRQQLWNLVLNAADSYGYYSAYLAYLEEHAGELTHYAERALTGYRNSWRGTVVPIDDQAITQFATILNYNHPLSVEQAITLNNEAHTYFDFGDLE